MKNKIVPFLFASLLGLALLVPGCTKSDSDHAGHDANTPAGGARKAKYFCPMHPHYTSDRPGDCPICNMALKLVKEGAAVPAVAGTNDAAAVPGRVMVMIPPDKQQTIGLRTSPVEERALSFSINASAVVKHDETRYARIAPRFSGWVKQLHVNFTGAEVKKGAPLFTVYSPELLTAENEYLLAWRQSQRLKDSPDAAQRDGAKRLLDSARRKLELWQIGDEEIHALQTRGQPGDELLLRAPFTGHVVTKTAVEGKSFMAGETLYELADLHRVWLLASIPESEFPNVHLGQKAWVTFPYLGNRTFESAVTFISPHIDPQTRRGEVRLELDNPGHALRADMWAQVEIEVDLGKHLTVPASAILDTGERFVAFVLREDNHLEPRDVKIGARTTDWWQVEGGLKADEKVVTRALFLVDSESQLKSAIAGMGAAAEPKH